VTISLAAAAEKTAVGSAAASHKMGTRKLQLQRTRGLVMPCHCWEPQQLRQQNLEQPLRKIAREPVRLKKGQTEQVAKRCSERKLTPQQQKLEPLWTSAKHFVPTGGSVAGQTGDSG